MQRYDGKTALLVIDVQNDFADPKGSLSVAGGEALIPRINGEIAMATSAGATVVATQDWHPESTPHFAKDGGVWPVHCVGGTWGAELHPDTDLLETVAIGARRPERHAAHARRMRAATSEHRRPTQSQGRLGRRAHAHEKQPGGARRRAGEMQRLVALPAEIAAIERRLQRAVQRRIETAQARRERA